MTYRLFGTSRSGFWNSGVNGMTRNTPDSGVPYPPRTNRPVRWRCRALRCSNALNDLSAARVIPLPGALPTHNDTGESLDSVGLNGGVTEDDALCTMVDVEAIGCSVDSD